MRFTVKIGELGPKAWNVVQNMVQTEYRFPNKNAPRVCATFVKEGETDTWSVERHAEMPLWDFRQIISPMLEVADSQDQIDRYRVAQAALTPDAAELPDGDDFLSRPAGADQ